MMLQHLMPASRVMMRRRLMPVSSVMMWQRSLPASGAIMQRFCAAVPMGLQKTPSVEVPLMSAKDQMAPSTAKKGIGSIGIGDRGIGLVYRDGRPASSEALAKRENTVPPQGIFIIKIQPPLDVSGDSEGGAGRITPATLLVNDKTWGFVRFVKEQDKGHSALLSCALSDDFQIGYRYAEVSGDTDLKLKVFTEVRPPPNQTGW
eukprot:gnl/MRDRNA2_/MRDRNA2_109103_c0_seq1.p1 gnl/MRDRNA2_/MRDRNA2_109103_c0~~gnl/MRDRNA2_/MRDRNA2_109103_c0_seq1.p1  ORF type:complete len:204 (-),score=38.50 gnl/MRDRNA2_/MRDRNA2_109103_c0_seq1:114-725(-)